LCSGAGSFQSKIYPDKHPNHEWKDYRIALIGNHVNQGAQSWTSGKSRKSWLRQKAATMARDEAYEVEKKIEEARRSIIYV